MRYALSNYLAQHGPCTIAELIDGVSGQGFELGPNAPKLVSDALRWEIGHGRVTKVRRATYRATTWPRTTSHRIHRRVLALRAQARDVLGPLPDPSTDLTDDEFWDRTVGFAD